MSTLSATPPRSRRRRRPSTFARWLRNFVQWSAVLLLALVGSSYAAWGIGHFLWVVRGREGNWVDRQRETMMGRFAMGLAPVRNPPVGDRGRATTTPPGLSISRVSVGTTEREFVEFAAAGNTQWVVNEVEPSGWMVHSSELQVLRMYVPPDEHEHPWLLAGPGAVYATDATGRVTRCTIQFAAPWSPRSIAPLQRMFSGWRSPSAIAWSADDRGRIVMAWILRDSEGVERQMVLVDWTSTPPAFGRRQQAALRVQMFDSADALWNARRETGGLIPTDPLADDVRVQLANTRFSAARELFRLDERTSHLSDKRFERTFGFGRGELRAFATTLAQQRARGTGVVRRLAPTGAPTAPPPQMPWPTPTPLPQQ